MYPSIAPDIKVKSTISHPNRAEEVIGFIGRNKKLGRTAVVLKEEALVDGFHGRDAPVPEEAAETLRDNYAELVVLLENDVLAMDSEDFAVEADEVDHQGRGSTSTMHHVDVDSGSFEMFARSAVEVGN